MRPNMGCALKWIGTSRHTEAVFASSIVKYLNPTELVIIWLWMCRAQTPNYIPIHDQ